MASIYAAMRLFTPLRLRVAYHFVEAVLHDIFEPLVDLTLAPEETLAVLHPLEITDGDTAGIGQDIGNDEDTFGVEHLVRVAVVGPLAPSQRMRAWRRSAFSLVI